VKKREGGRRVLPGVDKKEGGSRGGGMGGRGRECRGRRGEKGKTKGAMSRSEKMFDKIGID